MQAKSPVTSHHEMISQSYRYPSEESNDGERMALSADDHPVKFSRLKAFGE